MWWKVLFLLGAYSACAQRPNFINDLDKLVSVARIGSLEDSSQCACASFCANNVTAAECPGGRVIPRPECHCCFACAKQAGEPCDGVNSLCDLDKGLFCTPRRICEPKEPCKNDKDCSADKLCFGGACANPCKLFNPCARSLPSGVCTTRDHRPVCSCPKGSENRGGICIRTTPEEVFCVHDSNRLEVGQTFNTQNCTEVCECQEDGSVSCTPLVCPSGFFRSGQVQDSLCFEKREPEAPECCVRVVCESSPLEEEIVYYDEEPNGEFPTPGFNATAEDSFFEPSFHSNQDIDGPVHLMATQATHSTISLVWDDHVSDGRDYIVEYKMVGNQTWQTHEAASGNSLVLANLRPSTQYDVRLGVMDPLARTIVPISEEILVRTEVGCFDKGRAYPAGTTFSKSCESNCTCDAEGRLSCFPRCNAPFYRSGTFADDKWCQETPSEDSCCVVVTCSESSPVEEVIMKADNPSDEGESCIFKNQTYARGEKFFDGCEYSCECDENAEILCKPRCPPQPDVVELGCQLVPDPSDDCCMVVSCSKDQATPSTTAKPSVSTDGCTFKGATYRRGETFFDGCEQRCQCMGFGDVECTPRCPPLRHVGAGDCLAKQDPNDPCCSILVCGGQNNTEEAAEVVEFSSSKPPTTTRPLPETTLTAVQFGKGNAVTVVVEPTTTLKSVDGTTIAAIPAAKKAPRIDKIDLLGTQRVAMRFSVDSQDLANIRSVPGFVRVLRSLDLVSWESEEVTPSDMILDSSNPEQVGVEIPVTRGEQEVFVRLELGGNSSSTIALETKATGIPREGKGCLSDMVIPVGSNYTDTCGQHCHCADNGRAICEYSCVPNQTSDCPNVQRCNVYEEKRSRSADVEQLEASAGNSKFSDFNDDGFTEGRFPLIDKLLKQQGDKANLEDSKAREDQTAEEESVDALSEMFDSGSEPARENPVSEPAPTGFCSYKGQIRKSGEEFNDGCVSFCTCNEDGSVDCAAIECPHDFGLDLINPNCLDWQHQNKSREPPNCCAEPKCLNDGSCQYKGDKFKNFEELPSSASGCDKRCYCEFGNVTCSARCPPVTATPPRSLPCDLSEATLGPLANDGCCIAWQCGLPSDKPELPSMTEIQTPFGVQKPSQDLKSITNFTATPLNVSTVEVEFNIPSLYVGLTGYVEVLSRLFGSDGEFDSAEFRESDGVFASSHQRHIIYNLREDAIYEVQAKANLDLGGPSVPIESERIRVETPYTPFSEDFDLPAKPSMPVDNTLPESTKPSTSHPSKVVTDAQLQAVDVKTNEVVIEWRSFEQDERQLIDGIQLRYKNLDVNAQVFTMTSLLHRDVNSYKLEDLMPSTMYEVDIIFMPFENQDKELISDRPIQFKTLNIEDPYNFNVSLSSTRVGEMSTDLNWTGVPYPEDKYVSIYRVLFQGDGDPDTAAAFKLAKHDAPSSMTVKELKPGHNSEACTEEWVWIKWTSANRKTAHFTEYRFWIEAYLTNGKVKTSNVIDVVTKPGPIPKLDLAGAGPLLSSQLRDGNNANQGYFIAVIVLAIVAACALLLVLILSIVLARRGTKATATITARKSQSAYDNPSYKNYEAGDANGHRNKNLNDVL